MTYSSKQGHKREPARDSGQPSGSELVIVGIGASAGGLAALKAFFETIPPDTGMAFVVVVHLSPNYESQLAEILQGTASIPVSQVTEETEMAGNHVYVIPPNRTLEIRDGRIELSPLEPNALSRKVIDVMFRTLAREHPDSIGIILSGTGTDGTAGLKDIKAAGGLLLAQSPDEAEFDGMPRSAIATGLIDFVLPVRELAERLVDLRPAGEKIYKSTLEELETSKEELQSANEELETVNDQLNLKIDELSQANDDLKNFISSTQVATLFLDREFRIRRCTPPIEQLFNILPADIGRPISHITNRLKYPDLVEDVRNVLGTLEGLEREVFSQDGRCFLVQILPYRTAEDKIEGVILTFTDITSIRRVEARLERIEERYRMLAENVKEYAILFMDSQGVFSGWNKGAERIFGYREDEVEGKSVAIIFTEEDRASGKPEEELAVAREKGYAIDERWHVRKDGSRFWGSGVMAALHDNEGRLRGFAKVMRDNTQQREDAEALRKSEERLKALNETLEDRIARRTEALEDKNRQIRNLASELLLTEQRERHRIAQVLHDDLQQLLYGIQIKAVMLKRQAASNNTAEIEERADEIAEYLKDAVIRTRHLTIDLSPPILNDEGLKESLEWLSAKMKEVYGLDVRIGSDRDFPVLPGGMRLFLFQTTRELLFNIVKHASTEAATVRLTHAEDHIAISVKDEGAGFDPKSIEESSDEGSGFGLYSARERLRLLGGKMEVESEIGKGTEIIIQIPLQNR